jgi:uncharacterized protein (DUF1778 family)
MTRLDRIEIRATEQERERWQKAADREGWSLSEWMRRSLDRAATEQRKGRRK